MYTDREDNNIMSVSDTCSCRVRWIVGRLHWSFQDYVPDGVWWPERPRSDHYILGSSDDDMDHDESPWSDNREEDRSHYSRWTGGWMDGWNGRRGGRLDCRRNGWRDGGLVGGRTGGWDGSPRSSVRRTQPRVSLNWEKCCQWYNGPDDAEDWYKSAEAYAVHHDHHGYIVNGSSDSIGFGGGPIDSEQTGHRRRAPSSRRHRPRVIRGTEWF